MISGHYIKTKDAPNQALSVCVKLCCSQWFFPDWLKQPVFKGGVFKGVPWSRPSAVSNGCLCADMRDGPLTSHLLIILKIFSKSCLSLYPIVMFLLFTQRTEGEDERGPGVL